MMLRNALSVVRHEPAVADTRHTDWDVFLGTRWLAMVTYHPSCTAQHVREALIRFDHLDTRIVVRRHVSHH
jgi:hypothetical protein